MIYVWLSLFVVCVAVEIATVNLVSIWFAVGSLAALLAAAFHGEVWLQCVLFLAVSAVVLMSLRPVVRKYIKTEKNPTNADRVIGMVCPVTEEIDNVLGTGTVTAGGKVWTARSSDGNKIEKGTEVEIVRIDGVKLIVEKAKKEAVV